MKLIIISLLFVLNVHSQDDFKKEFHSFMNAYINQDLPSLINKTSEKNISQTSNVLREIGSLSEKSGNFYKEFLGCESFDEMKKKTDKQVFESFYKGMFNNREYKEYLAKISVYYIGVVIENETENIIIYKLKNTDTKNTNIPDQIKTIKVRKENDKWQFYSLDISSPKFINLILHYKKKNQNNGVK